MKKLWNALKLVGILVCFMLFLVFLFFDIIDLFIAGDFPDWVYVAYFIAWAVFGLFAMVDFIKKKAA